ncbi:FCD domain-containing protein [Phycicoccus sp.]|uniref:FadR/GntR family transcriptional regulator n=1 Tax=Phycicoccus sp. TaxID=1902410 RepID=UPI002B6C6033|nr:FCD domain-containing protein [Phycicoccus sp.]HMM93960.1 FCD domain-containing protein [Phycicoccus sp.]
MAPAPRPDDGSPLPASGLHGDVLDAVGAEIVSGAVPEGSVLRIDRLDERFGVSRSVVREAVRVLSSMGLVETRRRVGVLVRPRAAWHVFDPRVIRWRLDGPGREEQLLSLGELRRGFEPVAAGLAAERASREQCARMAAAVMEMQVQAKAQDLEAYLAADQVFHRAMLEASGNEMLAALAGVVDEVLAGRTHHDLMPARPNPEAIRLHSEVAQAIGAGDAAAAHAAMTAIIDEASAAVRSAAEPDA